MSEPEAMPPIRSIDPRPALPGLHTDAVCFMPVLPIDLGKVSKDLITRVTHKLSCANSGYRRGEIQPGPVKVMTPAGFVRQSWSLWVKRFFFFCWCISSISSKENKNSRLLTYSWNLSI